MRGQVDPQATIFHCFLADSRVLADHPLRPIKKLAERALGAISGELGALYSTTGRPSIAPERLLKGQLLIALYSIRSDRQFCEQLDYNILFRGFLDMDLESEGLDQSNFKGYHVKDFVAHLCGHAIRPHIARIDGRRTPGLDGRTKRTEGYRISQRKSKRVEEIFGWLKTVRGLRKSRFIGQAETQMAAFLSGAAYNLLRIAKLSEVGATS